MLKVYLANEHKKLNKKKIRRNFMKKNIIHAWSFRRRCDNKYIFGHDVLIPLAIPPMVLQACND